MFLAAGLGGATASRLLRGPRKVGGRNEETILSSSVLGWFDDVPGSGRVGMRFAASRIRAGNDSRDTGVRQRPERRSYPWGHGGTHQHRPNWEQEGADRQQRVLPLRFSAAR